MVYGTAGERGVPVVGERKKAADPLVAALHTQPTVDT